MLPTHKEIRKLSTNSREKKTPFVTITTVPSFYQGKEHYSVTLDFSAVDSKPFEKIKQKIRTSP